MTQQNINIDLTVDSLDYHILLDCVPLIKEVPGLTCEIGLRGGGATAMVMQKLKETGQADRTHIAIDPYGNIEYASHDNKVVRLDYTNQMRNQAMIGLYLFAQSLDVNFLFFNLEDSEFFKRYADGVPIYQEYKTLVNQYALVHFDGPHAVAPLSEEVRFFNERTPKGAMYVFDDVRDYDHERVEDELLTPVGFKLVAKTKRKASYVKER